MLSIDENFVNGDSCEVQFNIQDTNKSLHHDDIIKDNATFLRYPNNRASYSDSVFWSRFEMQNKGDQPLALILTNPRAGMDKIDVFVYHDKTLTQTHLLGDLRPQTDRLLLATKSVFYLSLAPKEVVTIVTRYENLGSLDFSWEIASTLHYSYKNSLNLWFWGIFGGLMTALIFYNFVMYLHLKKAVFLFYVIHATLLLWLQYAFNGILYFLDTGIHLLTITLSTWFVSNLIVSALSIFTILFFDFYRTNKGIFKLLSFLGGMNFLIALIYLYAFIDTSILEYTNYFILSGFLSLFIFLFVAIYSVYKRYIGAWYYLFGEGVYVLSLIYFTIFLSGKTNSETLMYVVPVAVLIEALMFTFALGSWIKVIRHERDKANTMILNEARFTTIGKNIGMAVHQWKEPLSQLSSHIVYFQALSYSDAKTGFTPEIQEHIESMSQTIEYMKETINDLYASCTNVNETTIFKLSEALAIMLRFQHDKLLAQNIMIEQNIDEEILLYGSKNALVNTLMIVCDNAISQFEKSKNIQKIILFESVIINNNSVILRFIDNGGGIRVVPISDIFEIDNSEKGEKGTGIGLALAKILVEKQLSGTIKASNVDNGACFELTLPLYKIAS